MSTGAISASVSSMTETNRRIEEYSGNIANVGTKGYKGFESQAQSIISASGKSAGGVTSVTRQIIDRQGKMERTEFETDLAISGQGFFVVTDKLDDNGNISSLFFTREGSFRKDNLGRFVNAAQYLLVGWPLDQNEELPETKSLTSSLSLIDVNQLISEASSTTDITFGANLNSAQRVAGGGVKTIDITNTGTGQSAFNHAISSNEILYPNPDNNLTKGEGLKLRSFLPGNDIGEEKIIEYGGFVETFSFDSTGTDLQQNGTTQLTTDEIRFQVNERISDPYTRGSGATNKEVLENLAQQINENSTGDFSLRARVVTIDTTTTLYIAPDKANYSLTLLGDATFKNSLGLDDSKNIPQFQITAGSNVIGRYASLNDLNQNLNDAGLTSEIFDTDGAGANITFKSNNPLYIENYTKGSGSNFLQEFGLSQGFLTTDYDPYDPNNNMANKAYQAQFSQDIEIYDKMGNKHVLIMGFLKIDTNTWAVELYANNPSSVNITGRSDGLLQAGTIKFDGSGNLQSLLNTTQVSKTKDITSPELALGATKGQTMEIDVSAGTTTVKHTFNYGSPIASSTLFTAGDPDLDGTDADTLDITVKTSVTDPGTTYNVPRGSGTTNLQVLRDMADYINSTASLKDSVRADIIYESSQYRIDIRPIDPSNILEFAETGTVGTDMGITSADDIAANSFQSLYELAEQINSTTGAFGIEAEVIPGTATNTYRLKIQPSNTSLNMTFNGDSQIISSPIGTGIATTIYEALQLKNTSSANQLPSLDDEFTINWSGTVGADPNTIKVDYGNIGTQSGLGQVSGLYSIKSKDSNGWSTGQLNGITVDSQGFINANFSNNRTRRIFKLALADFANPNGVMAFAGNVFTASKDSGPFNLKEAGEQSVGNIISGTLEGSNVDTADQLTKLIIAQRQYQASAKVISIVDKLQEELFRAF